MSQISRTPKLLVAATIGGHHQYPDGLVLYLGTMFAPVQDRDGEGNGFTHKLGDVVSISTGTKLAIEHVSVDELTPYQGASQTRRNTSVTSWPMPVVCSSLLAKLLGWGALIPLVYPFSIAEKLGSNAAAIG